MKFVRLELQRSAECVESAEAIGGSGGARGVDCDFDRHTQFLQATTGLL